jgi:hypothetical protein
MLNKFIIHNEILFNLNIKIYTAIIFAGAARGSIVG